MFGYRFEQAMIDIWEQECATRNPAPKDKINAILLLLHAQESNFTLHGIKFAHRWGMASEALSILHYRALEELILRPDSALETSLPQMALAKHYHDYKQRLAETGILDSIEYICEYEWELFQNFFPALCFALCYSLFKKY
mgnify:CR=1 FL=1